MDTQERGRENSKKYVRTPGAAKRLDAAAQTLERWRCEGSGPPFIRLTPKLIVYDVDDLDAWCLSRKVSSTSEIRAKR